MNEETVRVVPVDVGTASLRMEVRDLGGPEKVAVLGAMPFTEVTSALEAVGSALAKTMSAIGPHSATVELGVEVALEAGQLVALITKASGKANLKVVLEWKSETAAKI